MRQGYIGKLKFLKVYIFALIFWGGVLSVRGQNAVTVDTLANGVYRLSIGIPDKFTLMIFVRRDLSIVHWISLPPGNFLLR